MPNWGDRGVSRRIVQSNNGLVNWGTAGSPNGIPIVQAGILERLRFLTTTGNVTLGGGTPPTGDVLGPFDLYTQLSLAPNSNTPIFQASGYGAYLIDLFKTLETAAGSADTNAITVAQNEPLIDVYQYPSTTGNPMKFMLPIPVAQRLGSLPFPVGMIDLADPNVQMQFSYTPTGTSSSSPYNIYNSTVGQAPYSGGATTPTATVATPQVSLIRELWATPTQANAGVLAQPAAGIAMSLFDFISAWYEEPPPGASLNSATTFQWTAKVNSGFLARLGCFIFDSTAGVAVSKLVNDNSFVISTDNSTPRYTESGLAALSRMHDLYQFEFPLGTYVWDFLGKDLTLSDVMNTKDTANIQLTVNLSTALSSSNVFVKILRQMLIPINNAA